jgi:hypothetical protein
MAERAQVTSIDAIASFRAKLVLYAGKARADVEEVTETIQRMRVWLENDRRPYWERECRRCRQQLDEAQQQLFRARLSHFQSESSTQLIAVERAKRALRHAEEKRDAVKRWTREFANRAEPMAKQVEQLLTFVMTDLGKAILHLGSVVKMLEAYAMIMPGSAPSAATPAPAVPEPEATPPPNVPNPETATQSQS